MRNYSFCVLKKENPRRIIEIENNYNNIYVEIKMKRYIDTNIKEYFFAKGTYDKYGITEYYENMFWECEDKIILFADGRHNIKDFCREIYLILKLKLSIEKIDINSINRFQSDNKLKIGRSFIRNNENRFLEEKYEKKLSLSNHYYKVELMLILNQLITFVELIEETIVKLSYQITEIDFIKIVKGLEVIDERHNN